MVGHKTRYARLVSVPIQHLGHTKLITCFSDQVGLLFQNSVKNINITSLEVRMASIMGSVVNHLWVLIGILFTPVEVMN